MTGKNNLLFICNQNENRSLMAHKMFEKKKDYNIKSAGFYSEISKVNTPLLKWAGIIFVFEEAHVERLKDKYPNIWFEKRIINLEIPDIFPYGNEELKKQITRKMRQWWKFLKTD